MRKSIFFGMMGTPYQSELTTSLFRMVQAALDEGHEVAVWNCGYGTMLSQSTLARDADLFTKDTPAADVPVPTTAQMIQGLLRTHPKDLKWYVCDYCMRERGAIHHVPEVEIKIPFSFHYYVNHADQALILGVKS